MDSSGKVRADKPVILDAGAMHKHAAPSVPADSVRQIHAQSVELQSAASGLHSRHAKDHQRSRRVNQLRHAAWTLVVVAAILVAALLLDLSEYLERLT